MEPLLLVDDDVELCEILTEYFSAEGFEVESVHDGVRGFERARSSEHAIVILGPAAAPDAGLDVLRQLRASSRGPVPMNTD
jgi:DNA-binding response OmpR family regulator